MTPDRRWVLGPTSAPHSTLDVSVGEPGVTSLVAAFLAGRSPHTIRAYRQDIDDFARYLGVPDLDAAAERLLGAGPGHGNALALAYRTNLIDRQLAAATINRRLAALRSLVKLARTLGLVTWTLEVPGLSAEPYRDTRGPGLRGVRRLLRRISRRQDAKGRRDHAILRLLFDLGLRRGEVVSLDRADLDFETGTLAVLGKGRTGQVALTLPEPTRDALGAWLEARGDEPGPLFVDLSRRSRGGRLSSTSVYRLVRGLGASVGSLHAHTASGTPPSPPRSTSPAISGPSSGSAATGTCACSPATTTTARTSEVTWRGASRPRRKPPRHRRALNHLSSPPGRALSRGSSPTARLQTSRPWRPR